MAIRAPVQLASVDGLAIERAGGIFFGDSDEIVLRPGLHTIGVYLDSRSQRGLGLQELRVRFVAQPRESFRVDDAFFGGDWWAWIDPDDASVIAERGRGGWTTRNFELRRPHHVLRLTLPDTWQDSFHFQEEIRILPLTNHDFEILISVHWDESDDPDSSSKRLRTFAEQARNLHLQSAGQQSVPIEELKGEHGAHGFYYSVSRSKPNPSELKYFTHGMLALDDLGLRFTISAHRRDAEVFAAAIEALRGARHVLEQPALVDDQG